MDRVSIVISTRNRAEDLADLLDSILDQTVFPMETLVVDDSDNENTRVLVERMSKRFSDEGIDLRYFRGGGKSLAQARNIGASNIKGEIYCGIDDDVILKKDYIEQILKFFQDHPNATGVQGYVWWNQRFSALANALNRVFFTSYFKKDSCKVHATGMSIPYPLTRVIQAEWLSGTNSSYRRDVLKNFKWDENMERYSLCEDMDISVRILKCYPNSLYVTPNAKVDHKFSSVGRLKPKSLIYMEVAYPTYFFFKTMNQTLSNMIIYVWGTFFGRFILSLLSQNRKSILFLMSAYWKLLRNFKKVTKGDFSSMSMS